MPTRLGSLAQGSRWGDPQLASDGRYLYFRIGTLYRIAVNGGEPEVVDPDAESFDVDDNRLFVGSRSGEIRTITAAGATNLLAAGHFVEWLAAGAGRLFFSEDNAARTTSSLFWLPEAGGTVTPLGERPSLVGQIEVREDAFYWVEAVDQTTVALVRAGLDGSGSAVLVPAIADFVGFDVSGNTLVIATQSGVSVGPATGGERRELVADADLRAVVLDGDDIYYTRNDACVEMTTGNGQPVCRGKVFRLASSGGSTEELFSTEGSPVSLATDAACVYVRHFIGQCHPNCPLVLEGAPR